MDLKPILELYDREQRIELTEPGITREATPDVVRYINQPTSGAWITYAWLTPENIQRVIDEQVDFFERLELDFEWKVYSHDWPPDLKERLAGRGFAVGEEEAVLVADLQEAPPALFDPPRSDIRRLTDPDQLGVMLDVQREVWGRDFSWLRDELARIMIEAPGYMHIYAAFADGIPVSSAWVRFHQGTHFASLWGGSTVPAYRRRGIYHDLVAVRAIEARQLGFRYLTLDASPMSRAILEKLGFQVLTITHPCEWKATRRAAARLAQSTQS